MIASSTGPFVEESRKPKHTMAMTHENRRRPDNSRFEATGMLFGKAGMHHSRVYQSEIYRIGLLRARSIKSLFCYCVVLLSAISGAEADDFSTDQYKSMEYRLFEPKDLAEGDRVPLIVGLHGAGKRTADISMILMDFHKIASTPEFQDRYPCYVLAPKTTKSWFPSKIEDPKLLPRQIEELPPYWREQYPEMIKRISNAAKTGGGELEILFDLIDEVVAENAIDPSRIYVVGFSMGGSGTWQALAARPDFFAAAIPAAGGQLWPWQWNSELMEVPVWAFQGTDDRTTVAARHEAIFVYAKKVGGNMKYTEFEGANHEIVQYAFTPSGEIQFDRKFRTLKASDVCDDEDNVWKWLFSQRIADED